MDVVSTERLQDVLRSTFWLIPALCVAAAIGLGVGLVAVDQAIGSPPVEFLISRTSGRCARTAVVDHPGDDRIHRFSVLDHRGRAAADQ
ncbi:MAG TPA: hypothetical protein VFW64_20520 [Pseudonocardiaceae bacterium]|nr:hypothetical protein [Pseudonocardiaceae bacterium]